MQPAPRIIDGHTVEYRCSVCGRSRGRRIYIVRVKGKYSGKYIPTPFCLNHLPKDVSVNEHKADWKAFGWQFDAPPVPQVKKKKKKATRRRKAGARKVEL
jgi:hypothetical protein